MVSFREKVPVDSAALAEGRRASQGFEDLLGVGLRLGVFLGCWAFSGFTVVQLEESLPCNLRTNMMQWCGYSSSSSGNRWRRSTEEEEE